MRISDWSSDVCSSDLGVKYQPSNGNMLLTLAAYKIAQDNVNVIDPDYTSYSIQQGQYESRGLELEGRWNIARNFSVHGAYAYIDRSEEHTSELQSLMRISYAVFCLKKTQQYTKQNTITH